MIAVIEKDTNALRTVGGFAGVQSIGNWLVKDKYGQVSAYPPQIFQIVEVGMPIPVRIYP